MFGKIAQFELQNRHLTFRMSPRSNLTAPLDAAHPLSYLSAIHLYEFKCIFKAVGAIFGIIAQFDLENSQLTFRMTPRSNLTALLDAAHQLSYVPLIHLLEFRCIFKAAGAIFSILSDPGYGTPRHREKNYF